MSRGTTATAVLACSVAMVAIGFDRLLLRGDSEGTNHSASAGNAVGGLTANSCPADAEDIADLPGDPTFHIFVINMRARRQRLARMARQLSDATLPPGWQLDVHRIDPVTPRRYSELQARAFQSFRTTPEHLLERCNTRGVDRATYQAMVNFHTREVTSGEVACTLSHVSAARAARSALRAHAQPEGGDQRHVLMVFEDDATFDPATFFPTVLRMRDELARVDAGWDYLSLGHARMDDRSSAVSAHLEQLSYFYQAHAYVLSPRGAAKIVSRGGKDGGWGADVLPFDEYLPAAACAHLRADLAALECRADQTRLRAYGLQGKERLAWQQEVPDEEQTQHDTEDASNSAYTASEEGQADGSKVQDAAAAHTRAIADLISELRAAGANADSRTRTSALHTRAAQALGLPTGVSLRELCRSLFVVGGGSHEVNGQYNCMGETHKGRRQYRHASSGPHDKTARELFYVKEGWWNLQTVVANGGAGAGYISPHYGVQSRDEGKQAVPVAGWGGKKFHNNWIGRLPTPRVLTVLQMHPDECERFHAPGELNLIL